MGHKSSETGGFAIDLPHRTSKPRKTGITAITDVGIPIGDLSLILDDYGAFLDVAKIGVGTAAVTPKLEEKIQLYRDHDVDVYFGGTLFEKFYDQGKLPDYLDVLGRYGIRWIEVSNGTIDISMEERAKIVRDLSKDFTVIGEVGCKDAQKIMPPSQWISEMKAFLEAGCTYVMAEGRDSASAGIYRANHEIRTGLVTDIVQSIDADKIIFEAPLSEARMFFINQIGANVNLGNISPRDLLMLETERCALRCETFHLPL